MNTRLSYVEIASNGSIVFNGGFPIASCVKAGIGVYDVTLPYSPSRCDVFVQKIGIGGAYITNKVKASFRVNCHDSSFVLADSSFSLYICF